jgi:hypothetical protein
MSTDKRGWMLHLNGLTTLDTDTAKALAESKCDDLNLAGLTTLDADTTKALAEFKGSSLSLIGLTTLDADTAKALAEYKGKKLSLSGLNTLDADAAKALAEFKGDELSLRSSLDDLTKAGTDAAKAPREPKGRLIPPHDGPITRIPKRPGLSTPMPEPEPPAHATQSWTFAWLGIFGAVVLLVCYRVWKRRLQ